MGHALSDFLSTTGFVQITGPMLIMWIIAGVLLYLAVGKGFEPLLLVPIAFGALLANLPTRGMITVEKTSPGVYQSALFTIEAETEPTPALAPCKIATRLQHQTLHVKKVEGGLFDFISQGIKLELCPPLIFLGVGALTDFEPLIAMPRTLLLGAAAQVACL
ncbi:MAG: sodium ion-translocating decarboxylase subunit beta [Candidatus Synoicihabitans palmerolidicus]|nr:sodium ion-translocating decarboxylase subunit beta [Candidatus Synoicihabitans palmerolidicus]